MHAVAEHDPQTPGAQRFRQSRFVRPPGACELILVRHGESQAADPDRPFPLVDGQGDPPLHDPDGVEQARLACERLIASGEDFAAVYVTTLRRTRETARVLLDHLGVEPVVEPDLREVFLGEWEGGLFRKKVAERDPIAVRMYEEQRWDVIPGAETDEGFRARVHDAVGRIAAAHADRTVAVFTHGGVIGRIMAEASGALPFVFGGSDNCGITHIVVAPSEGRDRWIVRTWNDTAHLSPRFTRDPEPLI